MKPSDNRSKGISERKLAANKQNALKSTGPHDTRSSRYNAAKHGLLRGGLTELDDAAGFQGLCSRLKGEFAPVGEVETALLRRIALCLVRLRRGEVFEAEYITAKLNPRLTETTYPKGNPLQGLIEETVGVTVELDPGLPSRMAAADVDELQKFQRYETATENKLYRALNQLERMQRARRGEAVPAPGALDVGLHHEHLASFGNSLEPA